MFDIIDGNIKLFFSSMVLSDSDVPKHLHANFEILVVTKGVLYITINDKLYTVPEKNAIFIPPFSTHSLSRESKHSICALMFTKEIIPEFHEMFKTNAPKQMFFTLSDVTFSLVKQFIPNSVCNDDIFLAKAVLGPIIYELCDKVNFTSTKIPLNNIFYDALDYMINHSTENLTRESVAKALGVHPVTLSKSFSKHPNMNFNIALNQMRCNHAAILIERGNMNITEIAFCTGFGSIRSFNRAFMEIYGVTPNEFLKRTKAFAPKSTH